VHAVWFCCFSLLGRAFLPELGIDSEIQGKTGIKCVTMIWNQALKPLITPKKLVVLENSIMPRILGDVGKAKLPGVLLSSMSHRLKLSHNTIYNCPWAGYIASIWYVGADIISLLKRFIWETVRETVEHAHLTLAGRERQGIKGQGGTDEHFH